MNADRKNVRNARASPSRIRAVRLALCILRQPGGRHRRRVLKVRLAAYRKIHSYQHSSSSRPAEDRAMMQGFVFTMQANPVSARKTRTVHYRAGKEPWMPIAVPSDPTLTNQEFHNGSGQSLPDFPYLRTCPIPTKVLTRKYRPRSFDDVVSQEHVISTLRNAIAQNRISHAYLFCGPRGLWARPPWPGSSPV